MEKIKVKRKEELYSDEELLRRKDFNKSYNKYLNIKSSYSKLASLWGAGLGMVLLVGVSVQNLQDDQDLYKVNFHEADHQLFIPEEVNLAADDGTTNKKNEDTGNSNELVNGVPSNLVQETATTINTESSEQEEKKEETHIKTTPQKQDRNKSDDDQIDIMKF